MEFFALRERWLLGKEDDDYRFAMVCTILANANRAKRSRRFKLQEFLPDRRGKKKGDGQTWQQQIEVAKQITIAYGGKVPEKLGGPKRKRRRKN